jgi:putative ABC transport system substrate-binding protein
VRTIFVAVILALCSILAPAKAQQTAKIPRVGFLSPVGRSTGARSFEAFRQGLADLGYVEDKTVVIEPRFAEGNYGRVTELTRELVALKVEVIAVLGAVTVRAARKEAGDVPIVFAVVVDPIADDLVTNLDRPGGNVTGVTTFDPEQSRKQLELLREVIPGLMRVAFLGDQGVSEALMKASEEQARALGIQSLRIRLSGPAPDLEGVFTAIRQEHADALVALEEPAVGINANTIAVLATKYHIPSLYTPIRADAGFLLAYGTSLKDGMRGMAPYIDKILKGAKPGELPVQASTRYDLTVNLKTAKEIGVTISPDVLKRANQVIQ